MYIGYSEEQEALRAELSTYYDQLLTPKLREDLAREHGVGPATSTSSSSRRWSPCRTPGTSASRSAAASR